MPELSFDEIRDGSHFEDLVAAYFNSLKIDRQNGILEVEKSGIGVDEGVDIMLELSLNDIIRAYNRKWIIQCKFHKSHVSPKEISGINIPALVHSHAASGYLLICKTNPTSGLTKLFRDLNVRCKFGYHYEIWSGEEFKSKLYTAVESLHEQFFPKYYNDYSKMQKK